MPHEVFLSYAREDQSAVEKIADCLRDDTIDIWLDRTLRSGEFFPESINRALQESAAVICVWSNAAVRSDWVRSEALVGFERKTLVPIRIEPCGIPVPFNGTHAVDFSTWQGDVDHPEWRALMERLSDLLGRNALREWARRARPATIDDYKRVHQRYPNDPIAQRAADLAQARFGVDVTKFPTDNHELPVRIEVTTRDSASGLSLYAEKRRQLAEKKRAEISLDLDEFREALEWAHKLHRLSNDIRRLFPKWRVSKQFDEWEDFQGQLVTLAPEHATDEQVKAAYEQLYEEDVDGNPIHPNYGEVAHYIITGRVILSCNDLVAEINLADDDQLVCKLDRNWDRQIEKFAPPTFQEYVSANGGSKDYFTSLSLLNSWIRERFIEFCAATNTDPDVREAPSVSPIITPKPNVMPATRNPLATFGSWLALAAILFALIPRTSNVLNAAIIAMIPATIYSALVSAQAILPSDDTRAFLVKFWLRVPFQIVLFLFFISAFLVGIALIFSWFGIE